MWSLLRDHTAPAEVVLSMTGCSRASAYPKSALVVPSARRGSVRSRAMPPATASAAKKRKMVALHGKGGNAAGFERYMQPLVAATSETWEWDFVEGPHSTGGDGRAWWNLPPGVRTFEATELSGIEESLALLDARAPFDGVFGFSQGAMLAAVACGRGLKGGTRPSVAVIVGAAFPTARGEDVRKLMRVETAAAEADGEMRNAIPENLAEAAAVCGLSGWQTFWRVELPLAWPGILSAMVLTFVHTLGEFGVVLMMGGSIPGETKTVAIAIYDRVQSFDLAGADRMALLLLALSLGAVAASFFASARLAARR